MREHGEESGIAEGLQRGDARIAQRREGVVDAHAGGPVEGGWGGVASRALAREGDADAQAREFARVRAAEPQGLVQAHDGCVRCGMRRGAVGSGVGRGTPARNERRGGSTGGVVGADLAHNQLRRRRARTSVVYGSSREDDRRARANPRGRIGPGARHCESSSSATIAFPAVLLTRSITLAPVVVIFQVLWAIARAPHRGHARCRSTRKQPIRANRPRPFTSLRSTSTASRAPSIASQPSPPETRP